MEGNQKIIVLQRLEGNEPTSLSDSQSFLLAHIDALLIFWWIVWVSALLYMVFRIFYTRFEEKSISPE